MIPLPASLTIKGIWAALIALAFALLLALLAVQTVRLEGMKLWPFKVEGWIAKADRYKAERDRIIEVQAEARARQIAVNQAAQERYDQLATEADRNAEIYQSAAMDAARRYSIEHRVQPCAAGVASGDNSASESYSPGSGDAAGGSPIVDAVAVSEDDIRICTMNTVRLQAVREWAVGITAARD